MNHMAPARISPLCDKDLAGMSPRNLVIEFPGEIQRLSAHVCDVQGCARCYNEAAGYFDFVAGKPILDNEPMLCQRDAHPMFLALVSDEGRRVWRCPWCDEITTGGPADCE